MAEKGEKILLVGGAGFLGLGLAARLRSRHQVVLFDRLCHQPDHQRALAARLNLPLIEGDVLDRRALTEALDGCRRVVHLASLAGVERVRHNSLATMNTILQGTARLLECCAQLPRMRRLVFVSTSEVYGPQAREVSEDEVAAPLQVGPRRWTYAAAKLAAEHMVMAQARESELPVVVVRPFNIYGPGQMGQGGVKRFIERALAGQTIELYNGGDQVRAWCHLDDFCDGLLASLFVDRAQGQVFNLGHPGAVLSMRQLAQRVVSLAGSESSLSSVVRQGVDVHYRTPDIERARTLLSFEPKVDLDDGLARTIAWTRAHKHLVEGGR